jgi:hypothetical protein
MEAFRAYAREARVTPPVSPPRDLTQEQRVPLTVQSREEAELDEAEVLLKRQMPRAAGLYRTIDAINLGEAIRSEDPLRTYHELRRKALAPAARELLFNKMRHLQTP